ncbi:MAG: 23S rRNA (adenine(2030)-N(6))-methyltransferase RlmJ [Pseudomonadota bacterium]
MLKHIVLLGVLAQVAKKPKNFFVLDTHAGEGLYNIGETEHADDVAAQDFVNASPLSDIGKMYQRYISPYMQQHRYPGSPVIIKDFIRDSCAQKVSFHANELSNDVYNRLSEELSSRCFVHNKNAFDIVVQLLPPQPRRGLLLIDPPYEQAIEYSQVVESITSAYSVWPTGIYLLWYPLLSPQRLNRKTQQKEENQKAHLTSHMLATLGQRIAHSILDVRMADADKDQCSGMYGSGVCIINPPWKVDELIASALQDAQKLMTSLPNVVTELNWLKAPR